MKILASYFVNLETYYLSSEKCPPEMVTTEKTRGNTILTELRISKNLAIRANNLISAYSPKSKLPHLQYFICKTYSREKIKNITQDTYLSKLKLLEKETISVYTETVQFYSYTDKDGQNETVKVLIIQVNEKTTASIEFKNTAQHQKFILPDWLVIP